MSMEKQKLRKLKREEENFKEYVEAVAEKRRMKKNERIAGGAAVLMILAILPYMWGFEYLKFCLHKNQVTVSNITMLDKGWSEEHNRYSIDFSFTADFKHFNVYSFDVHTLVYKNGEFIGHIRTSTNGNIEKEFDDTIYEVFETNSTQTINFTFLSNWHTLEKSEDFFKELYNGNPEDYTFEIRVICVYFVDGTTVGYSGLDDLKYYYDEKAKMHIVDQYRWDYGYRW